METTKEDIESFKSVIRDESFKDYISTLLGGAKSGGLASGELNGEFMRVFDAISKHAPEEIGKYESIISRPRSSGKSFVRESMLAFREHTAAEKDRFVTESKDAGSW